MDSGVSSLIDVRIESAVCGAIIIDPRQADRVRGLVSEMDFSDKSLGKMFALLCAMVESKESPRDQSLLVARLKGASIYDQIGKAGGIGRLIQECGSPASSVAYAQRIASLSASRRLISIASRVYHECQKPDANPYEVSNRAQAELQLALPPNDREIKLLSEEFFEFIREERLISRIGKRHSFAPAWIRLIP